MWHAGAVWRVGVHSRRGPFTRRSTNGSEETDGVRVHSQAGATPRRRAVRRCMGAFRPEQARPEPITVAMLAALYRTDEMRGHMQRALDNGVTQTELKGLITHVAFYAGWPCAVNAGRIAIEVFGPK